MKYKNKEKGSMVMGMILVIVAIVLVCLLIGSSAQLIGNDTKDKNVENEIDNNVVVDTNAENQ